MAFHLASGRCYFGRHLPDNGLSSFVLLQVLLSLHVTSGTLDHWQDVLVGSVLGLSLAYFAYRQYYPPLNSELSHRPYAPRIAATEPVLPVHRHSPSEDVFLDNGEGGANGPYRDQHPSDDDLELDGTVRREQPASLQQYWKNREQQHTNV